jgi:transcriptional regulator with XRE-family HTH domain
MRVHPVTAKLIATRRADLGYTQIELGRVADIYGKAISIVETGMPIVNPDGIKRALTILGITAPCQNSILGGLLLADIAIEPGDFSYLNKESKGRAGKPKPVKNERSSFGQRTQIHPKTGKLIAERRAALGYTQKRVAKTLKCERTAITAIECGYFMAPPATFRARKMLGILGLTEACIDRVMNGTDIVALDYRKEGVTKLSRLKGQGFPRMTQANRGKTNKNKAPNKAVKEQPVKKKTRSLVDQTTQVTEQSPREMQAQFDEYHGWKVQTPEEAALHAKELELLAALYNKLPRRDQTTLLIALMDGQIK